MNTFLLVIYRCEAYETKVLDNDMHAVRNQSSGRRHEHLL